MMKWLLVLFLPHMVQAEVQPVLIRTLTEVTGGGLSVSGSTVTTTGRYLIYNLSIPVSSGAGFAVFETTGAVLQCSVNAVSLSAEYDFEIVTNDPDEFAIAGGRGVGKISMSFFRFLFGSHKAKIENATIDGTYRTRCVVKE